ncbi:hypothetical protein OH492_04420 [Vibrio chagasii]|nr:hypothetical protein [Vibrio chagasii]
MGRTFRLNSVTSLLGTNDYLAPKMANVIRSVIRVMSPSAFLPGVSAIKVEALENLASDDDVCLIRAATFLSNSRRLHHRRKDAAKWYYLISLKPL